MWKLNRSTERTKRNRRLTARTDGHLHKEFDMTKKQNALSKKDKAMIWNLVLHSEKSNRPNFNPQEFVENLKVARLCLDEPVNGRSLSSREKAQIWELVLWKSENARADFDFHAWVKLLKVARLTLTEAGAGE